MNEKERRRDNVRESKRKRDKEREGEIEKKERRVRNDAFPRYAGLPPEIIREQIHILTKAQAP